METTVYSLMIGDEYRHRCFLDRQHEFRIHMLLYPWNDLLQLQKKGNTVVAVSSDGGHLLQYRFSQNRYFWTWKFLIVSHNSPVNITKSYFRLLHYSVAICIPTYQTQKVP